MSQAVPPVVRKVAIVTFFVTHLCAAVWWCFSVFGMPERDAAVFPALTGPMREAGRAVEARLWFVDRPARVWVNVTASWQNWEMFAEPPRTHGRVALEGVERFEQGHAIGGEKLVLETDDEG